jgi:hydroxylamine reductase
MLLGEILRNKPEAAEVLMEMGMHCLGCPSSQMESLADACMVHGLEVDKVLVKLNS